MLEALRSFVVVGGAALALGSPVFLVARRLRRPDTMRNFLLGAGVIALFCAVMEVVSNRQVAQCIAAGNPDCYDAGTVGLQILFIGGYVATAWITAYSMHRS
jgi:hypothetical protein